MNDKNKKKLNKKSFDLLNADAAGIDIGANTHYVCVPEDRDSQPVQKFGVFTQDLYDLANWLTRCGIKTVAMESTGVYWIPLFQILEKQGFDVKLVNARYVKNVPGRKTDVEDCKWIQQLHSYGLLRGSFRPDDQICVLRSYIRQREILIQSASMHVMRMQKALTQMNILLHNVVSDITGVTGKAIITAILNGERNTIELAQLKDCRIKNDIDTIAKSLVGDYRTEHLFVLKQEFELYEVYQEQIETCDEEIKRCYDHFDKVGNNLLNPSHKKTKSTKKARKNAPKFDLEKELYNITGVNFTKIPGLNTLTVQSIIAETGLDMTKWPTEKHFASWLGLSPANRITGEKILSSRTRKVVNRASTAFRIAARAAGKTTSAIGAFYRRMKSKLGAPKAITATARKIACLLYRMLKFGQDYVEQGMEYAENSYNEQVLRSLVKKAKMLGFTLVPEEINPLVVI